MSESHSHYKKYVRHLGFVDVYRVLRLFDVTDPCIQHAIKKLLCAGQRGAKTQDQDIREAVDTLHRWLQMQAEDDESRHADHGWIEWRGGDCPVPFNTLVRVRYANNTQSAEPYRAGELWWEKHGDTENNIISYRVVQL